MGFHINVEDVKPEEIVPRVFKRVLMRPEQKGRGPPGKLTVTHYTVKDGATLTLEEPGVEYQDYIISGTALSGRGYVHANTTVFVPTDRRHSYTQAGEGELRIVSTSYSTPGPSHRWCKSRQAQLEFPLGAQQLMTEEYHALVGAQRFHALDVQDFDIADHTNPEETAYFLRGTGEMRAGDKVYQVKPGSLVYVEEGETHGVRNTNPRVRLQYYVMEYVEQDKMWSQRGYRDQGVTY